MYIVLQKALYNFITDHSYNYKTYPCQKFSQQFLNNKTYRFIIEKKINNYYFYFFILFYNKIYPLSLFSKKKKRIHHDVYNFIKQFAHQYFVIKNKQIIKKIVIPTLFLAIC